MVYLIFAAAVLGAAITLVALWHLGVVVAIVAAPFGASFLALSVSLIISLRCRPRENEVAKLSLFLNGNRKKGNING